MRVHISLDEALVDQIDQIAGPRGRSSFIAKAVAARVDQQRRWRQIESAFGSLPDMGHGWDDDPAAWVHEQRRKGERPLP